MYVIHDWKLWCCINTNKLGSTKILITSLIMDVACSDVIKVLLGVGHLIQPYYRCFFIYILGSITVRVVYSLAIGWVVVLLLFIVVTTT